jgi:hypothetical protein
MLATPSTEVTVTGMAPTQRVDNTPLPLSQIRSCHVTLNGLIAGNATMGRELSYKYPILPGKCVKTTDKWAMVCTDINGRYSAASEAVSTPRDGCNTSTTPPVTPPPATQYPAPTGFRIVGTTAYCVRPQDARELRMFKVRADGKLGDRVKTFSNCPTSYSFVEGQRYVLKAQYAGDKLSGWSNVATAP